MSSFPMRPPLFAAALLALSALPAAAGDVATPAWSEVGPPTARFGPAPTVRLGAVLATDLAGPVTLLRPGKPYDLEAFVPHLTGTPEAPAVPVWAAPVMARGEE